jgi:multidrug resistance efflux pump
VNDVSSIKAPGWQRVVAELTAPAADTNIFLLRMLGVLGQVSGARQGVLHLVVAGNAQGEDPIAEVRPAQVWPLSSDVVDAQGKLVASSEGVLDPTRLDTKVVERLSEVKNAAGQAAASRNVCVYALDESTGFYGSDTGKWHAIAVPIGAQWWGSDGGTVRPRYVATLLVESRSKQALQATLAAVELIGGYVVGHNAQMSLKQARQTGTALDLAARLIASVNAARNFKGAALEVVNDLARRLAAERVSLGWMAGSPARFSVDDDGTTRKAEAPEQREMRLLAMSDTEHVDRRTDLCRKLEAAMEESLDQEQAVLYPPPPASGPGSDALLSRAVTHAHADLGKSDAGVSVLSLPLRTRSARGERIAGVLTVEINARRGEGVSRFDPASVETLQATLDLLAPVLAVRASDDRNLLLRTWDELLRAGAWLVGPRHTAWKLAGTLGAITLAALFLIRVNYRVSAPMELLATQRRVLAAPMNGIITNIPEGIKAGARVSEGDVLLQLETKDYELTMLEARMQVEQHSRQESEALKKNDQATAAQSRAKAQQFAAREELARLQIERATIRAPFDGTIISGDVRDKVGSMVKLGDGLFEVADLSSMVVRARVQDSDVSYITVGQTGEISPRADPSLAVPFVVEQIVPLAQVVEGVNSYEVRGRFDAAQPQTWFLPGLEGQAKFNTSRRSLAWIGTRRVVDQLRVWLWW